MDDRHMRQKLSIVYVMLECWNDHEDERERHDDV